MEVLRPVQRKGVRRLRISEVEYKVCQHPRLPPGVLIRVLNEHPDPDNGARTLVVDLPAGWELPQLHCHPDQEEYYVIEGDLTVGDEQLRTGHYVYRPGGSVQGPIRTENGCTLLYWHDEFDIEIVDPDSEPGPVTIVDVLDESQQVDAFVLLQSDTRDVSAYEDLGEEMIRLRTVEETGDADHVATWIPIGADMDVLGVHQGTEEIYIVGPGWVATDVNHIFFPGDYLCWEPGVIHGPTIGGGTLVLVKHYGGYSTPIVPIFATGIDLGI
jgi:quercetin dioxygenase-like cupin family protein